MNNVRNLLVYAYENFRLIIVVFIAIVALPYSFLLLMQQYDSTVFIGAMIGCFIYLFVSLWMISGRGFYTSSVIARKISMSSLAPLVLMINTGIFAVICFGALTSALCDAELVRLDPAPEQGYFPNVAKFYLWHALELIPVLKINELFLNANPPFTYDQEFVSWLLLAFKIMIAWIIIDQIFGWVKWVREKKRGKEQPGTIGQPLKKHGDPLSTGRRSS